MDIERGIDGMIGRMLSWLVQAPIRLTAGTDKTVGSETEPIEQDPKPVAKKATARRSVPKKPVPKKPVPKKPAAKKATARKPVAKTAPKPRARKKTSARADTLDAFVDAAEQAVPTVAGAVLEKADEHLDRFVESAERASGGDDDLREKLLAALSMSADGASLAELHRKTGDTLANVRRRLNQLQEAGRIQRGKGMGTRYHLT